MSQEQVKEVNDVTPSAFDKVKAFAITHKTDLLITSCLVGVGVLAYRRGQASGYNEGYNHGFQDHAVGLVL